eukprot:904351-Heterocapsa_arctica.AAC.1
MRTERDRIRVGAAPRGLADAAGGGWTVSLWTGDVGRPRAGGAAQRHRADAGLYSGARLGQDLMIFEALVEFATAVARGSRLRDQRRGHAPGAGGG